MGLGSAGIYTDVGHRAASPTRHELAAICFDQKMIGRRQTSNTIGQFALDFPRKQSVCGEHGRRACPACSSHPASADRPPRGLGGGGALLRLCVPIRGALFFPEKM